MDASRTRRRARSKSEGECEILAFRPPFVLLLLCIYVETRKACRNRLHTQTIIKAIIDLLELRYAALSVFYSIKVRTHDPKWLVGDFRTDCAEDGVRPIKLFLSRHAHIRRK
jgi:hypothetical protein